VRAVGPKPALGGEFVIGLIGDSIGAGYGQISTGDGSDGLHYGGATVPAATTVVTLSVSQTPLTVWPDSLTGVSPDPGLMPRLCELALAAGYSSVTLVRHAVLSAPTGTVRHSYAPSVLGYLTSVGKRAHLMVVCASTNDSQTGESTALAALAPIVVADIEAQHPDARLAWLLPGCVQGVGFDEADATRAGVIAAVAGKATRYTVDGRLHALADTSHPTLAGYRSIAEAIWAAYQAGG